MTPHPIDPRDPVLDFDFVLELARRHMPSAKAVTFVDETGGEGRGYFIDREFVIKTQRPHKVRPRTSLEKEARHLQLLAEDVPDVSVPRLLGYGSHNGVEYLVMTRVPGTAVVAMELGGVQRRELLRQLGSTLRRMHAMPVESFRNSGLFPGDTGAADIRRRVEDELRDAVEGARGLQLGVAPEEIRDEALGLLGPVATPAVPLHSNPGPEHVFASSAGRLSGIIDFGDAYVSHPAFDLRRWLRLDDLTALMAGYGAVNETFQAEWLAITLSGFLYDAVLRPGRRDRALQGLGALRPGKGKLLGGIAS
jgi:hygromycin-B 7''-O-kinase